MHYEVRGYGHPLEASMVLISIQNELKRLYFGRDPLGRRSLLIHKPTAAFPIFILCSVSARIPEGLSFDELSSDHLFSLDLNALCSLDDVRETPFSLVALVVDNLKASRGLR